MKYVEGSFYWKEGPGSYFLHMLSLPSFGQKKKYTFVMELLKFFFEQKNCAVDEHSSQTINMNFNKYSLKVIYGKKLRDKSRSKPALQSNISLKS